MRATVPPTAGLEMSPPVEAQQLGVFSQRLTLRSALGDVSVRMVEKNAEERATLRQLPPPPPPPPPPGPNMTAIAEAQREAARL